MERGVDRWRVMQMLQTQALHIRDAFLVEKIDAAAEIGRHPVNKHQIQPEYGDEQADAGWNCRTRLARPDSQA